MDVDDQDNENTQNATSSDEVPPLPRDPTMDCAICLQPFVQPIQLPCSHTFCFLCAKGIALQRQPCALCRTVIPLDFLTKPGQFKSTHHSKASADASEEPDSYVWYYQGHKGWWQYDVRTSAEIEEAFNRKEKSIDILIAGAIYIIDFEAMVQYQRNMNSRKRKIKRDTIAAQKKGVAGMTVPNAPSNSSTNSVPPLTTSGSVARQGPIGDGNSTNLGSQSSGSN